MKLQDRYMKDILGNGGWMGIKEKELRKGLLDEAKQMVTEEFGEDVWNLIEIEIKNEKLQEVMEEIQTLKESFKVESPSSKIEVLPEKINTKDMLKYTSRIVIEALDCLEKRLGSSEKDVSKGVESRDRSGSVSANEDRTKLQ